MFNDEADDFLMRQGYVVVWCGWLAEVLPVEDENLPGEMLLRLDAPIAVERRRPDHRPGPRRESPMTDERRTGRRATASATGHDRRLSAHRARD